MPERTYVPVPLSTSSIAPKVPPPRIEPLKLVEPAEAVDPVCGMTVVADDSSYPFVHDGVTYYFCRVGCRRAFEADPAAYVKKGTRC